MPEPLPPSMPPPGLAFDPPPGMVLELPLPIMPPSLFELSEVEQPAMADTTSALRPTMKTSTTACLRKNDTPSQRVVPAEEGPELGRAVGLLTDLRPVATWAQLVGT